MTISDSYQDPQQVPTQREARHRDDAPLRPAHRSGALTALVTFAALATVVVTAWLAGLIIVNEVTCGSGLGTPRCGQEGIAVRALVATGVVAVGALVAIKVAGSFVRRRRAGPALIALGIALGAMSVLVTWLRHDLGLPFGW